MRGPWWSPSPGPPLLLLLCLGMATLLLLLLPRGPAAAAAPVQGPALSCIALGNRYYNGAAQKCCYICPAGYKTKTRCPMDPKRDCASPCGRGQYLNQQTSPPQCMTCVSCLPGLHLVEKAPCTDNSSRVCVCKSGLYCQTNVPNSCAQCTPLTTCKPGFGVKRPGTPGTDTVCEECSPGTFSDQESSTEACKPHTVCADLNKVSVGNGNSTHDERCADVTSKIVQSVTMTPMGSASLLLSLVPGIPLITTRGPMDEFNPSHADSNLPAEKPPRADGSFPILGVVLFSAFLLFAGLLLVLGQRRGCKKQIVCHKAKVSSQAKNCAISKLNATEGGSEETDPMNLQSDAETDSSSLLEMERSPSHKSYGGAEMDQVDGAAPAELPARNQTSNCIEKIYIMRADTVIVGSVSEVPAVKSCIPKGEEGCSGTKDGERETELPMHYPEQETAFHPGSDITMPVEEEWEFHHSALASEKSMEI